MLCFYFRSVTVSIWAGVVRSTRRTPPVGGLISSAKVK